MTFKCSNKRRKLALVAEVRLLWKDPRRKINLKPRLGVEGKNHQIETVLVAEVEGTTMSMMGARQMVLSAEWELMKKMPSREYSQNILSVSSCHQLNTTA